MKKGIDKPRPVTEADVGLKGLVAFMGSTASERAQDRFNLAERERELAIVLRELAQVRLQLARFEAFANAPSPSPSLH